MKKIGLYGGSFDPPHFGHLNLAISLAEAHSLDQVLFCPVSRSPFKEAPPYVSSQHRLEMLRLALQGAPFFDLYANEIERGGVSYTIDTVLALKEEFQGEFYLLFSEDSIPTFHQWKDAEGIVQLAKPLIGSRFSALLEVPESPVQEILMAGLTKTPILEISSTLVRNRLKNNLYCSHLVPSNVLDYIKEHRLYL